jgi:hypothetical protein
MELASILGSLTCTVANLSIPPALIGAIIPEAWAHATWTGFAVFLLAQRSTANCIMLGCHFPA